MNERTLPKADKHDETHWRSLPWNWALVGESVWLKGTHNGAFRAYGPHKVHNVRDRQLESGTPGEQRFGAPVFRHYAEDLLVPVDPIEKGGPR